MDGDEVSDEVHLGGFRFDLRRRALKRDGRPVQLGGRARDILWVLASAKGAIVSKDELMTRVWPGLAVEENNIQVHISALRKALDEGEEGNTYVVTVPGRGYRLIGAHAAPLSSDSVACSPEPQTIPLNLIPVAQGADASGNTLPDKPSIAVLPFTNIGGDPEQEYFADGVVEEIITALSRFSGLFVIARNSTFTYKGRAVDVKQAGQELGVRYVLEGSVRRAANRLRITGQLIDATSGAHIWADRFDGVIEDVFDLQDHITTSVVAAIAPRLEQAEIERARRKPSERLDAYDYYLRGMESYDRHYHNSRESLDQAMRLFERATELDPGFAAAYAYRAMCYVERQTFGWMADRPQEVAETARLARKAVRTGQDDAAVLRMAGHAFAQVVHDLDAGQLYIDRALAINPNHARAWHSSGWLRVWMGDPDTAIQHFAQFKRLSPLDLRMPQTLSGMAYAHFFAGRYDEACAHAEQALQENPDLHPGLRSAAPSHALAGRTERARELLSRLRRIDPGFRIATLGDLTPLRLSADMARYVEGMRKASLPE